METRHRESRVVAPVPHLVMWRRHPTLKALEPEPGSADVVVVMVVVTVIKFHRHPHVVWWETARRVTSKEVALAPTVTAEVRRWRWGRRRSSPAVTVRPSAGDRLRR